MDVMKGNTEKIAIIIIKTKNIKNRMNWEFIIVVSA